MDEPTALEGDSMDIVKDSLDNEAIATDSGVSNTSSLTSDTPIIKQMDVLDNDSTQLKLNDGQAEVNSLDSNDPKPHPLNSLKLAPSGLSCSLQDGLERTELLLTIDHPHGLSSLSLEVMTSGDQLNLLAEGLGSSTESSLSGGPQSVENNVEEEVKKTRGSCASASDAPGCVDFENHSSSPDESSRCSSSLGCLEPRPSRPTPTATPTHSHPSPNDLLANAQSLATSTDVTPSTECSREGERVHNVCESELEATPTKGGGEEVDTPRISEPQGMKKSRSTQSLNLFGGSGGRRISFGSIFNRKKPFAGSADHTSQTLAASSTTALILHNRPKNLPAKSVAEEKRHQRLYEQMVSAARKKELQKAKDELRKEEQKRQKDKVMEDRMEEWENILPKWESVHKSRKVHDLWWYGLPPGVRGKVWQKAIGNDLNISSDLYEINLRRCKERLANIDHRSRSDSSASQKSLSREQSVEGIHLDVLRTFPTLGFFQEGGPYNRPLHDVLGAYACYRPDIGYVQGMSFLAAVLLLNMDAADAFISLANLLNRPSYLAFFKVDHTLMRPYFDSFNILLQNALPKLSAHFVRLDFSPEYYLIEWIFTIYTRALPLDVACRVWDLFCRDGDSFLFRTAMGILRLYQSDLLEYNAIEDVGQFLGKLPPNLDTEVLFGQIESIHLTSKKFEQILQEQHSRDTSDR